MTTIINSTVGQTSLQAPSPSRLAANTANAQKSTGPLTDAGKAKSRLNALKSGLTGRTVLLPSEDAARYEQHLADWTAELQPVTPRESALVQSIADSHWRTDRIVSIEYSLFATGRVQFAELFAEHAPDLAAQLLEAHIYLTYEKQLRNLSVQEGRLRRGREKDRKALDQLQEERRAQEEANKPKTAPASKAAAASAGGTVPAIGFEFSNRPTLFTTAIQNPPSVAQAAGEVA